MQQLKIEDLQNTVLPSHLPAATELGVWKRSTGYEVVMPYRRGWVFWSSLTAGLLLLIAATVVASWLPIAGPAARVLLVAGLAMLVVAYTVYLLVKIFQVRGAKIKIDMTPLTLTMTPVRPHGVQGKVRKMPLREIVDVSIDERRGICLNGANSEVANRVWVGRGLKADDLYYLALLVGQVRTFPIPKIYAAPPKT